MARIELDLDEYNSLKNDINVLQQKIADLTKDRDSKIDRIDELEQDLSLIRNFKLFERLFYYKENIDSIYEQ